MYLWVSSPLIFALFLNLINPGYMYPFIAPIALPPGLPIVFGLVTINFIILYLGFRVLNI